MCERVFTSGGSVYAHGMCVHVRMRLCGGVRCVLCAHVCVLYSREVQVNHVFGDIKYTGTSRNSILKSQWAPDTARLTAFSSTLPSGRGSALWAPSGPRELTSCPCDASRICPPTWGAGPAFRSRTTKCEGLSGFLGDTGRWGGAGTAGTGRTCRAEVTSWERTCSSPRSPGRQGGRAPSPFTSLGRRRSSASARHAVVRLPLKRTSVVFLDGVYG